MNVEANPPPIDIDHRLMTPPSLRIVRTNQDASGDRITYR
jgi:S-ribosylhomocysteine lyase LuxS involved in autoinducer biosynthesis